MFTRFIHVVAHSHNSFLLRIEKYPILWIYYFLSTDNGHLDCFPLLSFMNNATINILVKFLCGHVFISLRFISRSGIAK